MGAVHLHGPDGKPQDPGDLLVGIPLPNQVCDPDFSGAEMIKGGGQGPGKGGKQIGQGFFQVIDQDPLRPRLVRISQFVQDGKDHDAEIMDHPFFILRRFYRSSFQQCFQGEVGFMKLRLPFFKGLLGPFEIADVGDDHVNALVIVCFIEQGDHGMKHGKAGAVLGDPHRLIVAADPFPARFVVFFQGVTGGFGDKVPAGPADQLGFGISRHLAKPFVHIGCDGVFVRDDEPVIHRLDETLPPFFPFRLFPPDLDFLN